MYAKKVQLINYGPIDSLEIVCPFDGEEPQPIVLVGENGSGKSILLSHIVNGLLCAQQETYPGTPEVSSGKVYKMRSPLYVRNGAEFAFSRVDFEANVSVSELLLKKRKKDYSNAPVGLLGTDAGQLWNSMAATSTNTFSGVCDNVITSTVFAHNCILYFPPNRFEDPAWLNESNLNAQVQHTQFAGVEGETNRTILNYSPLRENANFLFELAFDFRVLDLSLSDLHINAHRNDADNRVIKNAIFEGYSGYSKTLYDIAIDVLQTIIQGHKVGLHSGIRGHRRVSVIDNGQVLVPNIFQLSSGETSLLNIFLSILRDFDSCETRVANPKDVRGIVVIDEVDLHLHAMHQYTVLPQLIQMFPRVQFVLTTHSPLFVLGLHSVLGDDKFGLYRLPEGQKIAPEEFSEFENAYHAFSQTSTYMSKMKAAIRKTERPIIFVEGPTDVKYLNRAMELLDWHKTLTDVEIRHASGKGNLGNAWKTFTTVQIVRHTVVLLHDCDSNSKPSSRGMVFRKKIPAVQDHPIRKGIENLFSEETLHRVMKHKPELEFIRTIRESHKLTVRGCEQVIPEQWTVSEDEKSNLCDWICENGTPEDFRFFDGILDQLRDIPCLLRPVTEE